MGFCPFATVGTDVRRRGAPRHETVHNGDAILIYRSTSTDKSRRKMVGDSEVNSATKTKGPKMGRKTKPAWLDELHCASALEKTFLYEEVFGACDLVTTSHDNIWSSHMGISKLTPHGNIQTHPTIDISIHGRRVVLRRGCQSSGGTGGKDNSETTTLEHH